MATIKKYTKSNGTTAYQIRLYVGTDPLTGKKQSTTRRGFQTQREARQAAVKIEQAVNDGSYKKKKRVTDTYQDVYELWVVEYKNTVKESTYVKTLGYFKHHILPALGTFKIARIDASCCQTVVNGWFKQFKKYQTIMNYASMVFKYAIKHNIIERNPVDLITYPRREASVGDRKWENFYDKKELQQFLSVLDTEDANKGNYKANTLFRLLAFTGMRKGEALALTWADVDTLRHTINIDKGLTRGENARLYVQAPKTVNSTRIIDIDRATCEMLAKWHTRQKKELLASAHPSNTNKEQLVFCNNKNEYLSPSRLRTWLVYLIKKYNLKYITVHGFRHTHASLLFEAGATLKQVQDRLGHSDIKTTMNVYAHVSKHARQDTVDKFVNYLGE